MARIVAAFGTSHSTMLFSAVENWQALFDHVDCKAPINDFEGTPRSFDELLKSTPPAAAAKISKEAIAQRHRTTWGAMDRLQADLAAARLDVLIVVGDDQREIFQDACRPAIGIYHGETIRNAAAPTAPAADWYLLDQRKRMEDGKDRFYPCHPALATHIIAGLMDRNFDITAVKALVSDQFEGHAYSFVHRRYMAEPPIPIVPVFLNTYYPPNQPSPARCFELGAAIRDLAASFPDDLRVGVMASGGLSHFLVNEDLDGKVVAALRNNDYAALKSLPPRLLHTGSSEIRNWIAVAAAAADLKLDWLTYVPAYRSRAMTGVGLCFASWR
ncbi:MAG: protocatechuate 3,4-dioxygenase [Alphaproteobacteria bacterium]|nr:protocatechuate 3,4-dioxygenase [Alphaproteobacteria bacterium]